MVAYGKFFLYVSWLATDGMACATYSRVAERTFCDGLEEGRFSDVCKTDDTTLQAVAGSAQKKLLLLYCFLWWHTASLRREAKLRG